MFWVSFSPAPDCVDRHCWNRSFSTPTRHQERRYYCYYCHCFFIVLLCLYFTTGEFSERRLSLHSDILASTNVKILFLKCSGHAPIKNRTPENGKHTYRYLRVESFLNPVSKRGYKTTIITTGFWWHGEVGQVRFHSGTGEKDTLNINVVEMNHALGRVQRKSQHI